MTLGKTNRLSKLAREFNVGISTIVDFLHKKGFDIDSNPNTKVSEEAVHLLEKEYKSDINLKRESEKIQLKSQRTRNESAEEDKPEIESAKAKDHTEEVKAKPEIAKPVKSEPKQEIFSPTPKTEDGIKVVGKIDIDKPRQAKPNVQEKQKEQTEVNRETETKKESKPIAAPEAKAANETKEEIKTRHSEQATPKIQSEKPIEAAIEKPKVVEPAENVPDKKKHIKTDIPKVEAVKVIGKINLEDINQKTRPAKNQKRSVRKTAKNG